MTVTRIAIPSYDGRSGNYMPGRQGKQPDTIVIHWIDGTLAVADKVFQDPARIVSSHFAVEEGSVHQYVKLSDTAFHAGNWQMNLRSIGIEHSAQPGRDATAATYESSSQLVVQIAQALGRKVANLTFLRHSDIVPTQCPGTLDVGRIRKRAIEIESIPTAITVSVPVVQDKEFSITVSAPLGAGRFRLEPKASSPVMATYANGTKVGCSASVTGESVTITDQEGTSRTSSLWYRSALHGYYINATVATVDQPNNQS